MTPSISWLVNPISLPPSSAVFVKAAVPETLNLRLDDCEIIVRGRLLHTDYFTL